MGTKAIYKYKEGDILPSGAVLKATRERGGRRECLIGYSCGHEKWFYKPNYDTRTSLCKSCAFKVPTTLVHGNKTRSGESPTYTSWLSMKRRCTEPTNNRYSRYGGRGITVCERWLDSFPNFLEDMGERPLNHTLDRIDNDGDYAPKNCKWSTRVEQSKTKSNTIKVIDTRTGVIYSLRDACTVSGVEYKRAWYQFKRKGITIETVLGRPFKLSDS